MAFCKTLISGAKQKSEILWQKMHITTKISTSQGKRVCQYFNCLPQGWEVWEKRIKVQEPQCGEQELEHRCGHCSLCPRTVQWSPRQMGSLVCFHREKQRDLWAHKASATAVPGKLETLECECKNQDFINKREEQREWAATRTIHCYQGNFPQIHVRKRAQDLIITCSLCGMSLTVQERKRSCFHEMPMVFLIRNVLP